MVKSHPEHSGKPASMRRFKWLPGIFLLGTLGISLAGPVKGASGSGPFELRLILGEGPALQLELANLSASPQKFLADTVSQPVELVLKGPVGKTLSRIDVRSQGTRSAVPEASSYGVLGPGESLPLVKAEFEQADLGYQLAWGPYLYTGLPPGKYRAYAKWSSEKDKWKDSSTQESGRHKSLWKGKVQSQVVDFHLPVFEVEEE